MADGVPPALPAEAPPLPPPLPLPPPPLPPQEELDAQLLTAIKANNPGEAIRLLEQGANPNSVDDDEDMYGSSLLLLMALKPNFKDALLLGI